MFHLISLQDCIIADDWWFFLRRQDWLACPLLQCGQIGVRVTAEAGTQGPGVAPAVEAVAQRRPGVPVDPAQFARVRRAQAGRGGGDQAHLAAQNGGGRGRFAPVCPALVVALRAEELLEAVVGARQAGHGVAVEQPGPVAARYLAEVPDSLGERPRLAAVTGHGGQEPVEAAPDKAGVLLAPVVQDVGGPVHPAVGARDVRPERSRALQAAGDQLAQPREPRRAAPFSPTRSRLAATFSSRLLSVRPEAASGGRPSSVIALRTAAQ